MSIRFSPNDEHFYLKNGSINEGYMYDSVHLTVKGANKLAESLGLSNIIDGQNAGVCSYRPSQAHCYDHKSNEANNCDFNHAFWEVARGKVSRGPGNKRAHATTPMLNPHTAPSRDGVCQGINCPLPNLPLDVLQIPAIQDLSNQFGNIIQLVPHLLLVMVVPIQVPSQVVPHTLGHSHDPSHQRGPHSLEAPVAIMQDTS